MRHASGPLDLTGQAIGRWTVLERLHGPHGTRYRCVCECGTAKVVRQDNLRSGRSRSCGCLRRKPDSKPTSGNERARVQGHAGRERTTREYHVWNEMLKCCLNANAPGYRDHGGRGISVCERWLRFENFLADVGPRPEGHTLGRIDNDRSFEPGNCRWAKPRSTKRRRGQRSPAANGLRLGTAVSALTRGEKISLAEHLRAGGLMLWEIAALMGVSPSTVGDWLKDPDGSLLKARKERYRGVCVDCGGPTTGGLGRTNAPLRCRRCSGKVTAERTRESARDRYEVIARLWAEGKTSREIETIVGGWTSSPGGLISSMRSRGYDLPYRYDPARVPNMQEAAGENLRKAPSEPPADQARLDT